MCRDSNVIVKFELTTRCVTCNHTPSGFVLQIKSYGPFVSISYTHQRMKLTQQHHLMFPKFNLAYDDFELTAVICIFVKRYKRCYLGTTFMFISHSV